MEYTPQATQWGLMCICIVQVGSLKKTSGSYRATPPDPVILSSGLIEIEFLALSCFSGVMRPALANEVWVGACSSKFKLLQNVLSLA